jgi:hypothetical protein
MKKLRSFLVASPLPALSRRDTPPTPSQEGSLRYRALGMDFFIRRSRTIVTLSHCHITFTSRLLYSHYQNEIFLKKIEKIFCLYGFLLLLCNR